MQINGPTSGNTAPSSGDNGANIIHSQAWDQILTSFFNYKPDNITDLKDKMTDVTHDIQKMSNSLPNSSPMYTFLQNTATKLDNLEAQVSVAGTYCNDFIDQGSNNYQSNFGDLNKGDILDFLAQGVDLFISNQFTGASDYCTQNNGDSGMPEQFSWAGLGNTPTGETETAEDIYNTVVDANNQRVNDPSSLDPTKYSDIQTWADAGRKSFVNVLGALFNSKYMLSDYLNNNKSYKAFNHTVCDTLFNAMENIKTYQNVYDVAGEHDPNKTNTALSDFRNSIVTNDTQFKNIEKNWEYEVSHP
ncbi:MAG: hypothetical protein MRY21_07905 [Simkaniaceae bacterium]|nr:hypothetical protein [Simkaniaceae bacterium]